jgi:hypothetical protein
MLQKLIFVFIAAFFRPSEAIECLFLDVESGHYGCEVLNNQFNETKEIIEGKHGAGKSNADVTALFINGKNEVEFSPLFCRVFINLEFIHIERLEEARRDDFKDCRKVRTFKVIGTELFWLPEDVFFDMTELRELKMPSNKLMYLPAELLSKNLKLEKFLFSDNKLEVVDLQFSTSLKEIDLQVRGFICFFKSFYYHLTFTCHCLLRDIYLHFFATRPSLTIYLLTVYHCLSFTFNYLLFAIY